MGSMSVVARGRVQAHFNGLDDAGEQLRARGFDAAQTLPAVSDPEAGPAPGEVFRVHLLRARVGGTGPSPTAPPETR